MNIKNLPSSRITQSWIKRRKGNPQIKKDLYSELRDWVQHIVIEIKKNKDFKKKVQFLRLLNDLKTTA